MRNGSRAFLVDTNVLVYAYDPTDGAKRERAITVLERLGARQMGALSSQILGEFFVTVTRKIPSPLTAAEAERSLTNYVRSWVVYDLTGLIVLEAVRGLRSRQGTKFPFDANAYIARTQVSGGCETIGGALSCKVYLLTLPKTASSVVLGQPDLGDGEAERRGQRPQRGLQRRRFAGGSALSKPLHRDLRPGVAAGKVT